MDKAVPLRDTLGKFVIAEHGNQILYHIPSASFVEMMKTGAITGWKHNRPPDASRVEEIKKHSIKRGYVDGCISLAYLPATSGESNTANNLFVLCCYDGNHRMMAVTADIKPVLVSVLWDADDDYVANEFKLINKAISVPLMYTSSKITANIKTVVRDYTDDLVRLYPSHSSPSKACHPPSFNRDSLADRLVEMLQNDCYSNISHSNLIIYIRKANTCYAREELGFSKSKLKPKVLAKCEKSGLWLFATSRVLGFSYIDKVIVAYPSIRGQ